MATVQERPRVLALSDERRRFQRVRVNLLGRYMLADRREFPCQVIDMSLSGAAVATDQRPPIGTLITLGKTQGRIVRHLDQGFAVEFTRLQHPDFLEESVTSS